MRHGSLFSGIGGFDLAAQWMNWENVFHCEINPIATKILQYYWPNAKTHHDITKTDFTIYRGTIDVLSGGFPCQPFSLTGKRKGTEDSRHLWPEMLRAIREIQPCYVVGENVAGILNWDKGTVFQQVHTDLENEGYEVQAFILPACAVNAPHRRDRVWFIAQNPLFSGCVHGRNEQERTEVREFGNTSSGSADGVYISKRDATHSNGTNSETRTHRQVLGEQNREKTNGHSNVERSNQWQKFPTQSPVCGGDDGLPSKLDGITFSKWRNESIKAYGNAVVPQLVQVIFNAIQWHANNHQQQSTTRQQN